MEDGDPFETDEMDQRRAEHRRVLRRIPTWCLEQVMEPGGCPAGEEPLLELQLRGMADDELQKTGDLVDGGMDPSGKRIADFFDTVIGEADPDLRELFSGRPYNDPPSVSDTTILTVYRLMNLLIWADQLAGDGYTDPRLPQPDAGSARH